MEGSTSNRTEGSTANHTEGSALNACKKLLYFHGKLIKIFILILSDIVYLSIDWSILNYDGYGI